MYYALLASNMATLLALYSFYKHQMRFNELQAELNIRISDVLVSRILSGEKDGVG